jgi:hypothetical protein
MRAAGTDLVVIDGDALAIVVTGSMSCARPAQYDNQQYQGRPRPAAMAFDELKRVGDMNPWLHYFIPLCRLYRQILYKRPVLIFQPKI